MLKKVLSQIHWLIIASAFYGIWTEYQETQVKIEEIQSRIPAINAKIKGVKKKIEILNDFEADLERTRERVAEIEKKIKKAQRQLPNQTSDTVILDTFQKAAKGINVKEIVLRPGEEVDQGFYFSKEYFFSGKGTWLQFLIFFETLLKKERIYNVKKLLMKRTSGPKRGQFQFIEVTTTMEAFRYNSSYKEPVKEEEVKDSKAKAGEKTKDKAVGKRRKKQ